MLTAPEALLVLGYDVLRGRLWSLRGAGVQPKQVEAARLIELVLLERIAVEHLGRFAPTPRIVVRDVSLTGDPVLDERLIQIAAESKPRQPRHWLTMRPLAGDRYRDRLVAAAILQRDGRRHRVEQTAAREVHETVQRTLTSGPSTDLRGCALTTLALGCRLAHPSALASAHDAWGSGRHSKALRQQMYGELGSGFDEIADAVKSIADAGGGGGDGGGGDGDGGGGNGGGD